MHHVSHGDHCCRVGADSFDVSATLDVIAHAKLSRLRAFRAKIIPPESQGGLLRSYVSSISIGVEAPPIIADSLHLFGIELHASGREQQAAIAKHMENIITNKRQPQNYFVQGEGPARIFRINS